MRFHKSLVHRSWEGERGFTLVESVVAVFIAAVVLLGFTLTLLTGYRSLRTVRAFQQATAFANEAVEAARETEYTQLVMGSAFLGSDTRVTTTPCLGLTGPGYFLDLDSAGPLPCEKVVSSGSGPNHVTTETADGQTLTVSRYITWVDDDPLDGEATQSYKRVAAIVEWTAGGTTRSYRASTFVTDAERGLPDPGFFLTPLEQRVDVEQGNRATFAHSVRNSGPEDTFDLQLPTPSGRDWDIVLYKDLGQVGIYDVGIDTPLTDTNGNGFVDTGPVAPNVTVYFLGSWVLEANEPAGFLNLHLTATSAEDTTVRKGATDTLKVKYPGIELYLHNSPTPPVGDTTAIKDLAMNNTPPTADTLYRYSTDHYPAAMEGRLVNRSSVLHDSGVTSTMVNWVYQLNANATFNGTAELEIFVARKNFLCGSDVHYTWWIRDRANLTSDAGTLLATGSADTNDNSEPCDFESVSDTVSINNKTVLTSHWVEVKIRVNTSTIDGGLFAYDTTTYDSTVTLPQVSS